MFKITQTQMLSRTTVSNLQIQILTDKEKKVSLPVLSLMKKGII